MPPSRVPAGMAGDGVLVPATTQMSSRTARQVGDARPSGPRVAGSHLGECREQAEPQRRAARRWWAGAAGTGASSQCQWGWASPFGGEESVLTPAVTAITQRHEHTDHHWAVCPRESHPSKTCCTTVATQCNTLLQECARTHAHTSDLAIPLRQQRFTGNH